MTVSLPLDEDLVRKAEAYAARTGSDLRTLVEESLRARLSSDESRLDSKNPELLLPGKDLGVKAGVDFSNNSSWRDALDESDESLDSHRSKPCS